MSDLQERDIERPGIDRRTLIRRAAATGAVAWAAPTIIGSLASPAGAVTGGFPATCSYMTLVLQTSEGICAVKVVAGATACTNTNQTSSDSTFTTNVCGDTFSNTCASGPGTNNPVCRNGTVVPSCTSACPGAVTVSGGTVTANPGTTILFAVAHAGSCPDVIGDKFCAPCCGPTSCTAGC